MATPIDPTDREFVESTVLTGGQHSGKTLVKVMAEQNGLSYLCLLADMPEQFPWITDMTVIMIRTFLNFDDMRSNPGNLYIKRLSKE